MLLLVHSSFFRPQLHGCYEEENLPGAEGQGESCDGRRHGQEMAEQRSSISDSCQQSWYIQVSTNKSLIRVHRVVIRVL